MAYSPLRRLGTLLARVTPAAVKNWVHHHRTVDRVSRLVFRTFLGSTGRVEVESGPLKGYALAVSEHISHAHISGAYEADTQAAIDRLVQPGFVCYDLGASIGYLSLVMVARGASRVYAFEPAPHAAAEIRRHAAVNGIENIIIVPQPVSDSPRTVTLAVTDVAYGSSIVDGETDWPTLELEATTLDSFAATHEYPDFIKIDVEGEEDRVLEGARSILQRRHAVICCELHSDEDARLVQSLLHAHGYRITALDGTPFEPTAEIRGGEVQVLGIPER